MKKIAFLLALLLHVGFAGMSSQPLSSAFLKQNIKIFDIRTAGEWKETGILKNAIPLTFFDERGGYDLAGFLKVLNSHIKQGETFAIICHTGSRTSILGNYLGQNGYNVISLSGGMMYALQQGIKTVPYK